MGPKSVRSGQAPQEEEEDESEERNEDPIEIGKLIKLANYMAEGQHKGLRNSREGETPAKDRDFSSVKEERVDQRLNDLGNDIAQMKDAFVTIPKESQAMNTDIMKTLQQALKGPPPQRDPPPHRDTTTTHGDGPIRRFSNNPAPRMSDGCFYCGGNHFSREGKHKLGDGGFIPREDGHFQSERVENYWKQKTVSQNWTAQVDEDDLELARDEIRTLKVKLALAKTQQRSNDTLPVVPTFTTTTTPPAVQTTPAADLNTQFLHMLLLRGLQARSDGEESSGEDEDDLPEETKRRKVRIAEVQQDAEEVMPTKEPELPYRQVPEVVIEVSRKSPPRDEPKEVVKGISPPRTGEKLYRLRAPVQEEGAAKRIAQKILNGEVTFKARDVAAVSNEVREEMRRNLTKVRKPVPEKPRETVLLNEGDAFPLVIKEFMTLEKDALDLKQGYRLAV
ncbi:hypothetical protein K438DRAFT_1749696 [Mycena galopus ATCC 62051]|nr:hypothetical protein K438DRAFT_1749696 [Mycena galopus ATCC 62051]